MNNTCYVSSGTLTNCVKVESGAVNTVVANTAGTGAGTVTNVVADSGTTTSCVGQGCPTGTGWVHNNAVYPEGTAPSAAANKDICYGDSTVHAIECSYNNGSFTPLLKALGATSQKSETASADANVLTYTPPASVGTYRVCSAISVSSATSGVISWTLSWTDSNGNAQSNIAQQIFQMGTAAPNTTFTTSAAGNYYGCSVIDVNNAAASIIVKWVGGGTTAAKMSATVERLQ
jgi:hypothetical protein